MGFEVPPAVCPAVEECRFDRDRRRLGRFKRRRGANVDGIAKQPRLRRFRIARADFDAINRRLLPHFHRELIVRLRFQHLGTAPDDRRKTGRSVAAHVKRDRSADAELVALVNGSAQIGRGEFEGCRRRETIDRGVKMAGADGAHHERRIRRRVPGERALGCDMHREQTKCRFVIR